jgi:hypothetical protein
MKLRTSEVRHRVIRLPNLRGCGASPSRTIFHQVLAEQSIAATIWVTLTSSEWGSGAGSGRVYFLGLAFRATGFRR